MQTTEMNLDLLIRLFSETFKESHATVLEGGAAEPYYQPGVPCRIVFRSDYIRSALHEVAHWSLAGTERRRVTDYGYWYSPNDRDLISQSAFFVVEARPQAIEWLFCEVWKISFFPSVDSFSPDLKGSDVLHFRQRIAFWRKHYIRQGLPRRAALFRSVMESNAPSSRGRCSY